ncbi:MAG: DegT/DnrJ/EryC1/StrS family aminotransferase, partial [Nanoarchaeota archaeon]|nr:DegT/DnrJ/EryC1/StrS family aminotransferase [Nanoarchaeota archaeon]
ISSYNQYNKKRNTTFRHYNRHHQEIITPLIRELSIILNFCTDFEFWSYTKKFERKFAKLCNTNFSVGTHSGTAALQLSLAALGIGKNDEVITVPNTYIATALAISNTGAKPVFVDVDEETFNIDVGKIEEAITDRTKAIMPVHLYGQMADMNPILRLAKKHDLKVIEDACQAFGAKYYNKKSGSLGHVGCFSFFTGKNLGGLGNGGAIVSNNKLFIKDIRILRDPESNDYRLINSRRTPCYLDALQVAFLTAKLERIKDWIRLRREKAKLYTELLGGYDLILPSEGKNMKHSYYSYVIRCKQRDKLRKFLFKHRIETQVEYNLPIHLTKTFNDLNYSPGDFPVTEKLNKEVLSLPISPFLRNDEIEQIALNIKKFYKKI